jgi:hypothetical protein
VVPRETVRLGLGLSDDGQGWAVLLGWLATVIPASVWLAPRHPLLFWLFLVTMTTGLLLICYAKGERPHWRWGGSRGRNGARS